VTQKLDQRHGELGSLQAAKIYPSPENIDVIKQDREQIKQLYAAIQDAAIRPPIQPATMQSPIDLNNPRVRVAPSTFKGVLKGRWIEGEARIYDAADMQWVNALSIQRNGWFKRLVDFRNLFKDVQFVVIEVRLD
jgi:hypothetical protein